MNCQFCHSINTETAACCEKCGAPLGREIQPQFQSETQPVVQPEIKPEAKPEAQPEIRTSKRSYIALAILSIYYGIQILIVIGLIIWLVPHFKWIIEYWWVIASLILVFFIDFSQK